MSGNKTFSKNVCKIKHKTRDLVRRAGCNRLRPDAHQQSEFGLIKNNKKNIPLQLLCYNRSGHFYPFIKFLRFERGLQHLGVFENIRFSGVLCLDIRLN